MASAHMPRGFNPRASGRMDSERENFEKTQMTALQKALNNLEAPVKEKHCRRAILGTYQEHGCTLFWSIVLRFPLQGNPIVCWKFCHVLHKILRDGHENCSKDSYKYVGFLKDLEKLWGHLKIGLGPLIAHYAKLLAGRLNFHKKYPSIQGNLVLDDGDLEKICNNDINSYFEMCVDFLDFLDDILGLQAAVFGSLDMSRANSMTSVGQCRLAPLIPCILDSCQVYDSTVKLLFKLHSSLPPDILSGHRDRFLKQYKDLKRFYFNSGNLQYFKNLIRVPILPDDPPNFLIAANLASHVKPEAVMEETPEPEPDDAPVDTLVDTTTEQQQQQNGVQSPPMPDERDIMIRQLIAEVTRLKEELANVQAENQMMQESLHNRIRELEQELSELRQIAESTQQENELLRTALKDGEKNQEAATRLATMEKIAKTNEEKFKKIKEMYTRIKQEHVDLIRNHAEATKQLNFEKKAKEELEKERQSLQQQVTELQHEKSTVEETLNKTSSESAAELTAVKSEKETLEQEKQTLEEKLECVKEEKRQTEKKCEEIEEKHAEIVVQVKNLKEELERMTKCKQEVESAYREEQERHKQATEKINLLEVDMAILSAEHSELETKHSELVITQQKVLDDIQNLKTELEALTASKQKLESLYEEEQNKHETATNKIQSLESALFSVTAERDETAKQNEDWQQKYLQSVEQIKNLEEKLIHLEEEKATVEAAYQKKQTEEQEALLHIQLLSSELKEITKQNQSLQERFSVLSEEHTMSISHIQQLEENLSEVETKYSTQCQLHSDALCKIKQLERDASEMTAEKQNCLTELGTTQTQLKQAENKIQYLQIQLEQTGAELSTLKSAHAELDKRYNETLCDNKELTSQLDALKSSENDLGTKVRSLMEEVNKFEAKNQDLSNQLKSLEEAKMCLEEALTKSKASLEQKERDLDQSKTDRNLLEETLKKELVDYRDTVLVKAIEEAESVIGEALAQTDNPHLTTITCTAEYLIDRANPVLESIKQLKAGMESYRQDPQAVSEVVKSISEFSHKLADVIVFGFATSHAAPIEEGDALSGECKASGEGSLQLLDVMKQKHYDKVPGKADDITALVSRIISHAETLLPKVEDVKAEQMGDMVDQEMQQTTEAIAQAAERIANMLAQSREKYTGIQLEVNESILDSCNALMRAILKLVEKSKNLQREIVSQGRGTASAKDFYKKHHRWTEGLISAAKAVGWGANVLVEAADKVVRGDGKFEELMVCSQEIAASTTQLVVASKVKAQRGSENLSQLAEASRGVTECTARVVATAKSGADAIEEIDAMDFSKLTLHQSKRLEMESQVKVLELESCLEKERRKLSELRKTHYKLAGESEGWEQEDSHG